MAYPALLLLLLVAFYWKITLTYEYDWMWGPDLTQRLLPWLEEQARQMQHHHFPAWDPHTSAGQPFFGQAQTGTAYPVNWLLFLAPRRRAYLDTLGLQWYFVAIHYMAALFCYLLCRDLGLTRFASLVGGLVFTLGAYVGSTNLPQVINAAVWVPLVFLFLLRVGRGIRLRANNRLLARAAQKRVDESAGTDGAATARERWPDGLFQHPASAALCGLFWGMSWLSGDIEVPLFLSLAAALTWIYFVLRDRSWEAARHALLAVLFMLLTGALQFLPAWEYGRLAKHEAPNYLVQQSFSTSPITLLGVVIPGVCLNASPFIGIVALALSATAVATAWSRFEVKLFTALAAGAFAYALGFHNVLQGVLYAVVPFVNRARTPAMAIVIFGFGAAVLTACGIDQLRVLRGSGFVRQAAWGVAGFGLLIWIVAYCVLLAKAFVWPGDDRVVMTALLAVLAAALLFAWEKGNVSDAAATALLTALLLIELGNAGVEFADRNDYARSSPMQAIRSNQEVADFLAHQERPLRVDVESNDLPANWPEYHNFDQMRSSLVSVTENLTPLDPVTPQIRSLFGVQFTVGRDTVMPDAVPVFENAAGIKVFRNPHAFPRAWAVHELIPIAQPPDGQALIRDRLEELHSKAFGAATHTGLETCATGDAVAVTRHDAGHVTIRANMACDGMVVLSDTFYPGWRATVDKKPVPIEQVNFAMRGIAVPRGVHEIHYSYRPASVYVGAAMTATGVLGCCLLVFFERRRRNAIDLEPKRENNQN
jgi:hypothetical protein